MKLVPLSHRGVPGTASTSQGVHEAPPAPPHPSAPHCSSSPYVVLGKGWGKGGCSGRVPTSRASPAPCPALRGCSLPSHSPGGTAHPLHISPVCRDTSARRALTKPVQAVTLVWSPCGRSWLHGWRAEPAAAHAHFAPCMCSASPLHKQLRQSGWHARQALTTFYSL